MATTRESVHDGAAWFLRLLRVGVRRALVLTVIIAAFATLVVVTTRTRTSDCSDVTSEQRDAIASLAGDSATRSFRSADDARCSDGVFGAPIVGVADSMERATAQLADDGWEVETDYIAFALQLWRRCFSFDAPTWRGIQISVDADRGGAIETARAIAPENVEACELERREASRIYPPRSDS
ncbi:MAG: hypothetical protein AB8G26_19245 [Ilumatobacter sp.]